MARKRGEYQKKKQRNDRIKHIMLCIILAIGALVFFIEGVQEAVTAQDIVHQNLQQYSGEYQLSLKKYRHNTTYLFRLENGDHVEVSNYDLVNEETLNQYPQLEFHYSRFRSWLRLGSYEGILVTDAEGVAVFCKVRAEALNRKAVLLVTIGLIQVVILVILNIPISPISRKFERKKH